MILSAAARNAGSSPAIRLFPGHFARAREQRSGNCIGDAVCDLHSLAGSLRTSDVGVLDYYSSCLIFKPIHLVENVRYAINLNNSRQFWYQINENIG